ncbi:GDSL-like Lipase/Acylhydrolase superfamily protein [Euphorbia peplus]|nr:GDSL-like Lipase/Acylhydrolase superfamily protein [Euphorbia peplus]
MEILKLLLSVLLLLLCIIMLQPTKVTSIHKCDFQAIYNFGDSNSDTGAISAALSLVNSPNGESFFAHPSGRFCDGRLIIDFLAERLKLPYLSPYLDSIGTDFRHGANFATGGSSIRPGGYSPFHLGIQISQFLQFKARSTALYNKLSSTKQGTFPPFKSNLPRPVDFASALYTFDIGQNDLGYGFQHTTPEQVIISIPDILNQFSQALQQLYQQGARFFWVHNTGPLGCLPYTVIYNAKHGNTDRNGCVKLHNDAAQAFNRQLQKRLSELKTQLPDSVFTYVDVYSVKYQLISTAKSQGFVNPVEFCCGSYYGYHIDCGKTAHVNGTVYGNPCKYPSRHISWDGIHYSQAANLWVANHILNGSRSYPAFSVEKACQNS